MKKFTTIISLLVIALIMTACASSEEKMEITFDGEECIYSGPSEIPTGVYGEDFVSFNHTSDYKWIKVWIGRILDGKTWQDSLDLQSYPGEWVPAPDWMPGIENPGTISKAEGLRRQYIFDNEGLHIIWVESKGKFGLWPCAPITVFEGPSE